MILELDEIEHVRDVGMPQRWRIARDDLTRPLSHTCSMQLKCSSSIGIIPVYLGLTIAAVAPFVVTFHDMDTRFGEKKDKQALSGHVSAGVGGSTMFLTSKCLSRSMINQNNNYIA